MNSENADPDEDCVESFLMAWGLPGFVIGLALLNCAIFYIWHCAFTYFLSLT